MTWRAVLLGAALAMASIWLSVAGVWRMGFFFGNTTLLENAVAILFLVTLLNRAWRRRRPASALAAGEILTIYLLVFMGTGLSPHLLDFGGALAGTISYPFWFATPENRYSELLWPHLAPWLTVRDPEALAGFFWGNDSPYRWQTLRAWAGPALWWAGFLSVLLGTVLCLNSLVRRRWADEEKLPFPMTVLPVQLADERFGLLGNKLFWGAVAFSAALELWGALGRVLPALPAVPIGVDLTAYLANQRPWNVVQCANFWWAPNYVGLCYLMPLDLAFSVLVFEVLWVAEHVISAQLGWCTSAFGGFPYADQQAAGGYIAIVLSILWLDRRYIGYVLCRALGLRLARSDEGEEALGYRAAVLGLVLGVGVLWWFLVRGGMAPWVGLAFLCLYLVMALVLSRLRAQLGPPSHELNRAMPNALLTTLVGARTLGPGTIGMFALLGPYLQNQANHPGPLHLEALKMAEEGRMQRRRIALALALIVPVAMLCYFWASLHIGFHTGMSSGKAAPINTIAQGWVYDDALATLRNPSGPSVPGTAAMGLGLAAVFVLMLLKLRFPWWPLHPAALPIAASYTMQGLFFAILATWLTKALLLRYGGLRAHRRALPLFLGLIAGGNTAFFLHGVVLLALRMSW